MESKGLEFTKFNLVEKIDWESAEWWNQLRISGIMKPNVKAENQSKIRKMEKIKWEIKKWNGNGEN